MEDVIISGLDVKAAAAERSDGEDAYIEDQQFLEMEVRNFKDIHLDTNNIAACQTLPRKDRNTKPVIIVRFVN